VKQLGVISSLDALYEFMEGCSVRRGYSSLLALTFPLGLHAGCTFMASFVSAWGVRGVSRYVLRQSVRIVRRISALCARV